MLTLTLRDAGEALPDAAALFSPALDMTGASPSMTLNATRDAMFDPAQLLHLTAAYLAGADPSQPLASPLLGSLAGLPPLLLHVGEAEVLRDDAVRLAQKAREAGVRVDLQVFPVVPHGWQLIQLDFTSGYVQRAAAMLPKQGHRRPWKLHQNYVLDLLTLRLGKLADGVMAFARGGRG